jgi:CheY-like chemotaxis protein
MSGRVLLIEDEPNIAEAIRFILSRDGWEVTVEENGAQALPRVADVKPDLVILDLMLPGMSGLEILSSLRADPATEALRVLMLTAKGQGRDREAAERAALNAPIQGTAADIIKRAMVAIEGDISRESLASRMVLQVHDELVFEVAPGERSALEAIVVARMSTAAELAVPIEVQLGWGANWDEAAH